LNFVVCALNGGSVRHGMVYGHFYLAREWVRLGHDVTIIAASYSHSRSVQPEVGWRPRTEYIDGIRYRWIPTARYAAHNNIGRVWNMLGYSSRCLLQSGPLPPADVVICSSHHPFAIYASRRCARRHGAALVFEVRDLWPLTLIEIGGISPRHPFVRLMQLAEDYAYGHADLVVSVLPEARDYMVGRGMQPSKFLYVPNGADVRADEDAEGEPFRFAPMLDEARAAGQFLIGYAGTLNRTNVLHTLIEAIAMCEDGGISAAILGRGPALPELQAVASRLGVESRVLFLDSVPKSEVRDFLSRIDVAYLGLQHKDFYRFGVSLTKFNDYMLASRPIVAAMDAPGNLATESGAGVACPPERAPELLAAINSLREMSPGQRAEMGARGRGWIIRNRDYAVLARKFLAGVTERA
jgi:glycosyltransferase involved in cell wall biosynthesis